MTRGLAFHPPLFALYPPLSLYAANVSLIAVADVWAPCLVTVLFAAALWVVAALVLRDVRRGAAVSSALTFAMFLYGPLRDVLGLAWSAIGPRPMVLDALWVALTVTLALASGWKWKNPPRLTTFLNATSVLACLFALASVLLTLASARSRDDHSEGRAGTVPGSIASDPPDVFYIVLDGFGRDDVLSQTYGMEEGGLADSLEERDFYVARDARANYCQTELSLASSLNLAHIESLVERFGTASQERLALDRLIGDSRAERAFRSLGYRTIAVTTGFPALRFPNADVSIASDSGRSLFLETLIERTPLRSSQDHIQSMFATRRKQILGGFDQLKRLAKRSGAPRFVFVHVLAPHPPFVFGPNGEPRVQRGGYALVDGSHFMAQAGTKGDYLRGYGDQAKYVTKLVVDAVDSLLSEPGPKPIVLIQGDHGPKMEFDQESRQGSNLGEVFSILSAYFVPAEIRARLYPSITPVNSFRIVLNGMTGDDLPTLDDRSYYSPWSDPLALEDVTDKIARRPEEPPSGPSSR